MSATAAERNARRTALAAEIASVAEWCSEDAAGIAAGSYLTYGHAPGFGLSDAPFGMEAVYAQASRALREWLAAEAHRVAA